MTVEEMKKRKEELGYSYERISELSSVPLGTVQKVFSGITKHPRYNTLKALENIFVTYENNTILVREPRAGYGAEKNNYEKKQGDYTYEDYCAIPEDIRVELIDGFFYDMAAPSFVHQTIVGEIYYVLLSYIKKHMGGCRAAISPIDVKLDNDDKTVLQPDLILICNPEIIEANYVSGAPDFVVEVMSPSTKRKDMYIKLNKYQAAGVREYWMVDPEKKNVVVYDFEQDEVKLFGFNDVIPVGIFHSEEKEDCLVDFRVITETLDNL